MNTQITTTPSAVLLAELLEDLRERRRERGLSLANIGEAIGKSPIYARNGDQARERTRHR
jgi:hypothetical protein